MTREAWLVQFADWLETPALRAQRLKDDPSDHKLHAYYHWTERNIDFISLDNSTTDQFDPDQMKWLHAVLARDEASPQIRTIVVGMHEALPGSMSRMHSMSESPLATRAAAKPTKRCGTRTIPHTNACTFWPATRTITWTIFSKPPIGRIKFCPAGSSAPPALSAYQTAARNHARAARPDECLRLHDRYGHPRTAPSHSISNGSASKICAPLTVLLIPRR